MTTIQDVINCIHEVAPPALQESYDNAGLMVGNSSVIVTGITLTLDITEEVIDEAIENKDNLIVAHHPIIFSGLKKLNGKNYVERCVIKAIKNDIALFAAHTNLDNVLKNGVNSRFSDLLGLKNQKILAPKKQQLKKLTTFIPVNDTEKVMSAVHKAGAGNIGNYENCSFRVTGTGYFTPNDQANPTIGENNKAETVEENRVEMIFPTYLEGSILNKLKSNHPYEEVAYFLHPLDNSAQDIGSGMVGELANPMPTLEFLHMVKERFNLNLIKHTAIHKETVQTIAVCGGAGSFLLRNAMSVQADVFITSDYKYHEFFDADGQIIIADIGHFESEVHTKELFYDILRKKITNIALNFAKTNTNPVKYLV